MKMEMELVGSFEKIINEIVEAKVQKMFEEDVFEDMNLIEDRVKDLENDLNKLSYDYYSPPDAQKFGDAPVIQTPDEPAWIVNDLGELGVKVNNRYFFLYKGHNLEYIDGKHDDGSPMHYRIVGKREFGETCNPEIFYKKGHYKTGRYTEELVYIPGLSDGKPEDGRWKKLPSSFLDEPDVPTPHGPIKE